ncbi:MAG: OmpA family protein, partial [Acidobacteria bacterium]|nr:OmpA family protein [Acidobacteriota bacterium]
AKITMTPVVRQVSVPKSVTQDASGISPGGAEPLAGIPLELRRAIEAFSAYFETDESTLQKAYRAEALGLGERLQPFAAQIRRIRVVGHCDTRGSEIHNQELGQQRAASLAEVLSKSLDGVAIVTETLGSTNPDPPGQDPAAWSKNRWARMQIEIQE